MDHYTILSAMGRLESPSVMATIIGVHGHSYRKAGAAMLLLQDGGKIGSISPGCLEADLLERTGEVLESGNHEIIEYNLNADEDAVWGESVGCGGAIRVLLEPVSGELQQIMRAVYERTTAGETVGLTRILGGRRIGYRISSDKPIAVMQRQTADWELRPDIRDSEFRLETFHSVFSPRPRLLIFGAGDDSIPVCELVGRIGFRIVVADWRASLCSSGRFPGAEIINGLPQAIIDRLRPAADDYALISSHQLQRDREMLEGLLPARLQYIGVLGSQSRIRQIFAGLSVTSNVRAPVGMAIGADGPQEIAVSIAAELIAVRSRLEASRKEGADLYQNRGYVSGGRSEQENGRSEAVHGAFSGRHPWEPGAS
ncbi:XdhC family protein [Paenibacillus sp. sptzw28]|uniref:XdhC family protein n=1 Tax=Paenibacillus sp. sptzw28 TaxID=715179 RepID=UPI001C6DEE2A|nr:XdhC/CoxI family protein [Paenibacillus sp. sptzw28]QYR19061.1 XdhC family protein [Paenibacillus sp. sptzw28]